MTIELSDVLSTMGAYGEGDQYKIAEATLVTKLARRTRSSNKAAKQAIASAIRSGMLTYATDQRLMVSEALFRKRYRGA